MNDRTPPQDLDAERAVLAAALQSKRTLEACSEIVTAADFYQPTHADIWQACVELHTERQPVDKITVKSALQTAGNMHALKALLDLTGLLAGDDPAYHARIVADRSRLRAVIAYGQQLIQRGHTPGDDLQAEAIIADAADRIRTLRDSGVLTDDDMTAITIDELLQIKVEHDWVVPNLLERGDRLLLTGSEGLGKSYLSRQIAVCAASGLHPFDFSPCPPMKVLVIDAENSIKINARAYGWMQAAARSFGVDPKDRLLLDSYPYGMNVIDPRQGNKLIRMVELQQPDLIVMGPLYKIHELDDEKAADALRIQHYLDRVRSVCGSALIMELHSPHGSGGAHGRDMRPAGSSVWRRWPEFGYGLTLATGDGIDEEVALAERIVDVRAWRGPRDERAWPVRLRGGKSFPWIPANAEEHHNVTGWGNAS